MSGGGALRNARGSGSRNGCLVSTGGWNHGVQLRTISSDMTSLLAVEASHVAKGEKNPVVYPLMRNGNGGGDGVLVVKVHVQKPTEGFHMG